LNRALALGAVCGLRTFTAPGVLAARGRWGDGIVTRIVPALALCELVYDKLPSARPRGEPRGWIARTISGAVVGASVSGPSGALAGAAAAALVTRPSERLRRRVGERTGIPDPLLGMAEDTVAITIATWASRGVTEPR
jgi:uncharacterized membrane protein